MSIPGNVMPTEEILSRDIRLRDVTTDVLKPMERFPNWLWWVAFLISNTMLSFGVWALYTLLCRGQGIFGLNHPVGWAFDITNFVFWVGIGHAGTLISAILFLLRQKWRTAINRSAEAMTIFAVMCAGIFPLFHVGRQWLGFWLVPYPNDRLLWVNFRSPLLWDVFAVSTYFTISLLFWFTGLVPDFAAVRDRATSLFKKKIYGALSLGWTGSTRSWNHYEKAYLIFAGMATALVLSVHTVVSYDFATAIVPGWHTTIFPPYFVAGAIFSGFAMVLTLLLIMRKAFQLEHLITVRHLELMCKIILVTGLMVGYSYLTEFFVAWYSENPYERYVFYNRVFGHFSWAFWIMFSCNAIIPNIFFIKKARNSLIIMFIVSLLVNVGMWFERFNIIVTSLHHDFLPANWDNFTPTIYDFAWTIGVFGLFFTLFLLFARFFPTIAIAEMKGTLPNPVGKAPARESSSAECRFMPNPSGLMIGLFTDPNEILHAADKARQKGWKDLDAITPYPIHGMEHALGLKMSWVPWVTLSMGLLGAFGGYMMEAWTSAVDWRLIVGGKPFVSWPAFIPITFECGILIGGISTFFAMWAACKLPNKKPKIHHVRLTDDMFGLVVPLYEGVKESDVTQFLKGAGANEVRLVEA